MLKGIPSIISPDMMKVLMEMGHGDEVVLADANFPAASCAQRLVRCDGHRVSDLLAAILHYFPLDRSVDMPVVLMAVSGNEPIPDVWKEYKRTIQLHGEFRGFEYIDRFSFYERAKSAYAIIATGDQAPKANILLKKGVVRE
ncbi:fucose isomerase [Alicyclobacillus fastidiosus]|uniref:Fucose isomerase n=1 Tax=Alicyclobacillus fastidiosus TaxID=392011 RepID=A0ABY6ZAD2_9BACL|nr:RbsD/FucU domain-containing protein [Alicyclobacillus fastidiosus]WAH39829.1 fucose isomerase [Alicyclobacillus fastidiosus]GMA61086.1 fucose isomerase [Alicyclobacillus fastidiosus]